MRLIRNITEDGTCKYGLIRLDKIREAGLMEELQRVLGEYMHEPTGNKGVALNDFVEFGLPNTEEEFFVVKLKDINSHDTLMEYASRAKLQDIDFAEDIQELAQRAGPFSPWAKVPD